MGASRSFTDFLMVFIIGVCIGLFLSQRACNDSIIPPNDTTYIVGKSDTVIIRDTITKTIYKPIANASYPSPVTEPIGIDSLDSIRVYTNSIVDSSGGVTVRDSIRGVLLSQDISLFSKAIYVNRVDTLKILIPAKDRLRLGVGAMLNDSLQPSGYIVALKGRYNYIGSYNLIKKQISIGVGINLIK